MRVHPANLAALSAAVMTRAVACATYPPGSWAYNNWGCGTNAMPAPAPSPVSAPAPSPSPTPAPSPAPIPGHNLNNTLAYQLQAEANARIASEIQAAENARVALEAQQAADAARAALAANQLGPIDASGPTHATFAPGSGDAAYDASTLTVQESNRAGVGALAIVAALGIAVLVASNKKKR